MLEIYSAVIPNSRGPTGLFFSLKAWKRQSGCCAMFIVAQLFPPADFIRSRTKPLGSESFEAYGPFRGKGGVFLAMVGCN